MAAYDSPGFSDKIPGGTVVESTGFGGSQPTDVPTAATSYDIAGTTATSAFVVPVAASTTNGDRMPVGPLDTLVGPQADLYVGDDPNVLSGGASGNDVGFTGIGQGNVSTPPHPNSLGVA